MFRMEITPRLGDTDALGHINNIAIPEWFETARDPIFRIFVPELDLKKWNMIMAHMEVDFKGQLFYGRQVMIKSYISKIGNTSFTVYQQAWQDGNLCATGSVVIVHFNFQEQKAKPVPDNIRVELSKHLFNDDCC